MPFITAQIHMKRTRTQSPPPAADLYPGTAGVPAAPQPHDVIQFHAGPHRGVLAQIGLLDHPHAWCYLSLPGGSRKMLKAALTDLTVIGRARCCNSAFLPTDKEKEELK